MHADRSRDLSGKIWQKAFMRSILVQISFVLSRYETKQGFINVNIGRIPLGYSLYKEFDPDLVLHSYSLVPE